MAGDPDAAFAAADLILEGEYRVGHQEQLYIENNAMIAVPTDDGGVTVHGSLQCPYYVHSALKRGLAMDDRQARVVQAETGGGFGGKEEYPSIIGLHAALLAGKAHRPVRMARGISAENGRRMRPAGGVSLASKAGLVPRRRTMKQAPPRTRS